MIRACSRCGTVFESPWATWQVWFCLVCSCILLVVVPILMVLAWVGGGFQANTVMALVISIGIGATILPAARRQRRFHREWLARRH